MTRPHDDDLVRFSADDEPAGPPASAPSWKVMIVDDDQEVQ